MRPCCAGGPSQTLQSPSLLEARPRVEGRRDAARATSLHAGAWQAFGRWPPATGGRCFASRARLTACPPWPRGLGWPPSNGAGVIVVVRTDQWLSQGPCRGRAGAVQWSAPAAVQGAAVCTCALTPGRSGDRQARVPGYSVALRRHHAWLPVTLVGGVGGWSQARRPAGAGEQADRPRLASPGSSLSSVGLSVSGRGELGQIWAVQRRGQDTGGGGQAAAASSHGGCASTAYAAEGRAKRHNAPGAPAQAQLATTGWLVAGGWWLVAGDPRWRCRRTLAQAAAADEQPASETGGLANRGRPGCTLALCRPGGAPHADAPSFFTPPPSPGHRHPPLAAPCTVGGQSAGSRPHRASPRPALV